MLFSLALDPLHQPEPFEVSTEQFGTINVMGFYCSPLELCSFAYKSCVKAFKDDRARYKNTKDLLDDLYNCQNLILRTPRNKLSTVIPIMKNQTLKSSKCATDFVRNPRTSRCLFISLRHNSLSAGEKIDLMRLNGEWEHFPIEDKKTFQMLADHDKVRKEFETQAVRRLHLAMSLLMQSVMQQRKLKRRSAFYCFQRHMAEFKIAPKRAFYCNLPAKIKSYYDWLADHREKLALETLFKAAWESSSIRWYSDENLDLTSKDAQPVSVYYVLDELRKLLPGMQFSQDLHIKLSSN
mmetsp:Transcript_9808/g.19287  ORF Transcript_9808/g.19287 Transcript_9808/m.19287 type:complete len:295 (-) Transcript_9808:6855-7739(-)